MLKTWTTEPDTLELLKKIQLIPDLTDTSLFGGAAIAFHLGHRSPNDLDLFGTFTYETITEVLKLESFDNFCIILDRLYRKSYLINRVKVDIVKYDRQWLESPIVEDNIRLAGLKDLAAMKVDSITNRYDLIDRRSKKDFVDLFYLLKVFKINEILDFYHFHYPDSNITSVISNLTCFEVAENEDMPKMFVQTSWEEVKKRIISEVKKIGGEK